MSDKQLVNNFVKGDLYDKGQIIKANRYALREIINKLSESNGENALMYALSKCTDMSNKFLIKWLLQHGANPNLCKASGTDCPIETAIDCGKLYGVQLLIDYGCKFDQKKILEKISRTDRFKSVIGLNEKNKIYELISKDYKPVGFEIINQFLRSNKDEMIKMLKVVEDNDLFTLKPIKDADITDVDVINENGTTALMYQAQYGDYETMEYLIKDKFLINNANVNIKDNKGNNALFYAIDAIDAKDAENAKNANEDNVKKKISLLDKSKQKIELFDNIKKKIELLLNNGIQFDYDKLIYYVRSKYFIENNKLFNDFKALLDNYNNKKRSGVSIGGNFSKNNKIKDDIYKNKYLKYKNKYLDLKKSI